MERTGADAYAEALAAQRVATAALVVDLTAEIDAIVVASEGANLDDEHDPDGATVGFERARVQSMLADAVERLAAIDAAIEQAAAGRAPRCDACGTAIPLERLLAVPTTRRCVSCASGSPTPAIGT